jgi:hypothetical protein
MTTYQVQRTRGGRHCVIALDAAGNVLYRSGYHTSAEPALTEARNHINGTTDETEPAPLGLLARIAALFKKPQTGE